MLYTQTQNNIQIDIIRHTTVQVLENIDYITIIIKQVPRMSLTTTISNSYKKTILYTIPSVQIFTGCSFELDV